MKRIFIVLMALVLTTSIQAQQKKGKTDMAKKVTTEMTEVLGLDKATSAKVYELQSQKFKNIKAANVELKDDKAALQAKKKEINAAFRAKMGALVGKDNYKKWAEHLKAKKAKKTAKKK